MTKTRPLFVLAVSLGAALLFAALVAVTFHGEMQFFLLTYYVPIGVPFVAFLFDRADRWLETTWLQRIVDLCVLILALARAVAPVPLISGHTLFLVYALLSSRSWVVRVTAALVLLEVIYLKVFVWRDPTLIGGAAAACLAAWVFRRVAHSS